MSTVMSPYEYVIRTRFDVQGNVPGLSAVTNQISRVESAISGLSRNLFGGLAALAGTAGLAMAVKQVVALNSEMQTAQVGLAALYTAFTKTPMNDSLRMSVDLVRQLRLDAAAGAGGLSHYLEGIQTIMGPSLAIGASMGQIRELNRLMLNAGFAMRGSMGFQLAALDVYQALTMGAGSRTTSQVLNPVLMTQRMTPESFNKLEGMDRFNVLMKAFGTMGPAVEAMSKTWSAQLDTFIDRLKQVTLYATQPLFDRWTAGLRDANKWLKDNQERLRDIAYNVGDRLIGMWNVLQGSAGGFIAGGAGLAGAAVGGALFGPIGALVVGGITAAIANAWQRFPDLRDRMARDVELFTQSVENLVGSVARLSEDPLLSNVSYVIGTATTALTTWITRSTTLFSAFFDTLYTMAVTGYHGWMADFYESGLGKYFTSTPHADASDHRVAASRVQLEFEKRSRQREYILGGFLPGTDEEGRFGSVLQKAFGAAAGNPAMPTTNNITNLNGPITIKVEAERLDSPHAVVSSFDQAMRFLREHPRRARGVGFAPKPI